MSGHLENQRAQANAALWHALKNDDTDTMQTALDCGANINAFDAQCGRTVLMAALEAGQHVEAIWLLVKGASAISVTSYGGTPLHAAVQHRAPLPILAALCDRGADPNFCQDEGDTALMRAAGRGNAEAVELLLERGGEPNTVYQHRTTFEHATCYAEAVASRPEVEATLRHLILHGADMYPKACMFHLSMIDAAVAGGYHGVVWDEMKKATQAGNAYDFAGPIRFLPEWVDATGRLTQTAHRLLAFGHLPMILDMKHWEEAPQEALKLWNAVGPYYRAKHQEIDLVFAAPAPVDDWKTVAARKAPFERGGR